MAGSINISLKDSVFQGEPQECMLIMYVCSSYLHCDWKTQEELEITDKRVNQKIKRYHQKQSQIQSYMFNVSCSSRYLVSFCLSKVHLLFVYGNAVSVCAHRYLLLECTWCGFMFTFHAYILEGICWDLILVWISISHSRCSLWAVCQLNE